MSQNKQVGYVIVAMVIIGISYFLFFSPSKNLMEMGGTIGPKIFIIGDFTLKKSSTVSFYIEMEKNNAPITSYVVQWDPVRFSSLEDHVRYSITTTNMLDRGFLEKPLGTWEYVSIQSGTGKMDFELNLVPGEWGLVIVQTNQILGDMKFSAVATLK